MHRLLVISSGSWKASVLGRNALGRLLAARAGGLFREVDYVFFPAGVEGCHEPEEGFRVHEIPGRSDPDEPPTWMSRWSGLREGWRAVASVAEEARPTVVNAVEPFLSGLLAGGVARRLRIPRVTTVVSNYRLSWEVARLNPVPFLPPSLSFSLERRILAASDRIHVDCDHYADYVTGRGASPSRVRRIPRYADPVFYRRDPDPEIWARLEVPDPTPLVYVGRLSPEKYAMELARTFLVLARHQPDRHLVVVGGGGPLEQIFLDRLRQGGVGDRVLVRRGLSREEIVSVMGRAGALLATHAGYALLEAALAGAPVVAYDYEWHPELIRTGDTGILVPYRDSEAMAGGAMRLLDRPGEARRMAAALRGRARQGYGLEDHLSALRRSYAELLSPGAAARDPGEETTPRVSNGEHAAGGRVRGSGPGGSR